MPAALLDLLDSTLQLWHGDRCVQSPGYALLNGQDYVFGTPARATARLKPRDVNTRYWWRLSTEALQPALGPARHTGDLVHAHLMQLHAEADKPSEIMLAVPASMQRDQLALLLGIVQQCPFDAVALVNRSVALASLFSPLERLFHLEIQLHQAVISELTGGADSASLKRCTPLPGCGLLQLQERLVEIIAAEFIRQTRFDPRRKATTEQQLYDALPQVLRTLNAQPEANLDIGGYQARISALQLQDAGKRLFESIRENTDNPDARSQLIADPLAGLLPGLTEAFTTLHVLSGGDLRTALHNHQEQIIQRQDALSFVTDLPFLGLESPGVPPLPATVETRTTAAPTPVEPTHLLQGHTAMPLHHDGVTLHNGWVLYRDKTGWQLRGDGPAPHVNGSPYLPGQPLIPGDRVSTDKNAVFQLIEVTT